MIIAGIGSRETPTVILQTLTYAGSALAAQGHRGSSGGAKGADTAFEAGYRNAPHLLTSWRAQQSTPEALELASRYHPAWDRCSEYAKILHARNGFIVLGADLNSPVDAIICWTVGGQVKGGTGQALRIALDWRIPIFNLAVKPLQELWSWMWERHR